MTNSFVGLKFQPDTKIDVLCVKVGICAGFLIVPAWQELDEGVTLFKSPPVLQRLKFVLSRLRPLFLRRGNADGEGSGDFGFRPTNSVTIRRLCNGR